MQEEVVMVVSILKYKAIVFCLIQKFTFVNVFVHTSLLSHVCMNKVGYFLQTVTSRSTSHVTKIMLVIICFCDVYNL